MNTLKRHRWTWGLLIILGTLVGCGRSGLSLFGLKPLAEVPKDLVSVSEGWRLLPDSKVKGLKVDCYTFVVSEFKIDFQGLAKAVVGNRVQSDEQATPFSYYIFPGSQVLCMDYQMGTLPNRSTSFQDLKAGCEGALRGSQGSESIYLYSYTLNRQGLHMVEYKNKVPTGNLYHYFPFDGAKAPGTCQF